MTEMIYVTAVEPLEDHRIRATFSDGAIKAIDVLYGRFESASGHRINRTTIKEPATSTLSRS